MGEKVALELFEKNAVTLENEEKRKVKMTSHSQPGAGLDLACYF